MRGWGSIVLGAMGLAVLEAIVSSKQATSNVGGFIGGLGALVQRFIDPTVPFFSTQASTTAITSFQAQSAGSSSSSSATTPTTIPPALTPSGGAGQLSPGPVPLPTPGVSLA